MAEPGSRMTENDRVPGPRSVAAWIGADNYTRWKRLLRFIEQAYPGVFKPEWLFGGRKYGWGLRLKKSKSFCTLIPERDRMVVLIVFGGGERTKAEALLTKLTPAVRKAYRQAPTYHDGKWVVFSVDRDETLTDIQMLLGLKRRNQYRL